MSVAVRSKESFDFSIPVIVVGGGACGLCAALAARDAGCDVLVVERDPKLWGTTSMSTGLIPAAGTADQARTGIDDHPQRFADDILRKTHGQTDAAIALRLAEQSADTVDWLRDRHGVPLSLITDFLYPGHSAMRMYGMPNRSGGELMAALEEASRANGVDILTNAHVTMLFHEGDRITGVGLSRPDGRVEEYGCDALILACCGFAGAPDMVRRYIPELEHATFHGHPGNKGDAMLWAEQLGVRLADMSSYQGHGGLAADHGIPILWPLIMEGGYQVNRAGLRFADESAGYSEHAVKVLAQPGRVAWSIFDQQRYDLMMKFDDFQQAVMAGAINKADTIEVLADTSGINCAQLLATNTQVDDLRTGIGSDTFGRDFAGSRPLAAPFYCAKVTGALFHTQGGISVDIDARAVKLDGSVMPNLYAGGGAARGISGPGCDGYMAGNGLLSATTLGKLAGRHAGRMLNMTSSTIAKEA